mmetsp:Transcript_137290/g.342290  ORF Transcript_137290/g.342290 Transcript_137290/m.342290 type:complete len:345 (+) Transcript_137290:213-1247(+)
MVAGAFGLVAPGAAVAPGVAVAVRTRLAAPAAGAVCGHDVLHAVLGEDAADRLIETDGRTERGVDDVQHSLLVLLKRALAALRVERLEASDQGACVLRFEARTARGHEVDLVEASAHVDEREELHDAPKTAQVGGAAEHHHALATAQEDRQATQIAVDVVLIDAALVEPHPRLTLVLHHEGVAPLLEGLPLGLGIVVPRVGDEGVALEQTLRGRLGRERRTELVVSDVLEAQIGEQHAAEALGGLGHHLLDWACADQAGHASSRALLAFSLESGGQQHVPSLPQARPRDEDRQCELRGQAPEDLRDGAAPRRHDDRHASVEQHVHQQPNLQREPHAPHHQRRPV